MGYSTGSPKSEVYSTTIISQETIKVSNTQPDPVPKGAGKRTANKANPSRRREIIKIRAEINKIETIRKVEQIRQN